MSEFEVSPTLFFFIGLSPVFCAQTALLIFKVYRGEKISQSREFLKFVFAIYILFTASLMFFPVNYDVDTLLVFNKQPLYLNPLNAITRLIGVIGEQHFSLLFRLKIITSYLAGNLLMLFPFGIMLPVFCRTFRKLAPCLLLGLAVSVLALIIQYIESAYSIGIIRTADIDNVILNVAGLCFGFFLYRKYCSKLFTQN